MEELDAGDTEGKTKMAFAKMQVPNELRGQYLLDDKDFEVNNDKPSTAPKVGTDDLLEGSQSALKRYLKLLRYQVKNTSTSNITRSYKIWSTGIL